MELLLGTHCADCSHQEAATAPFQYAFLTGGHGHALQSLADENQTAAVMSIDGMGVISRKAMLQALMRIEAGPAVMPFSGCFMGKRQLISGKMAWELSTTWSKGKKENRGTPRCPSRFALGQHAALTAIQVSLGLTICTSSPQSQVDCGKCMGQRSQSCGLTPAFASTEERPKCGTLLGCAPNFATLGSGISQATDPEACVWRGSGLPTEQLGNRV